MMKNIRKAYRFHYHLLELINKHNPSSKGLELSEFFSAYEKDDGHRRAIENELCDIRRWRELNDFYSQVEGLTCTDVAGLCKEYKNFCSVLLIGDQHVENLKAELRDVLSRWHFGRNHSQNSSKAVLKEIAYLGKETNVNVSALILKKMECDNLSENAARINDTIVFAGAFNIRRIPDFEPSWKNMMELYEKDLDVQACLYGNHTLQQLNWTIDRANNLISEVLGDFQDVARSIDTHLPTEKYIAKSGIYPWLKWLANNQMTIQQLIELLEEVRIAPARPFKETTSKFFTDMRFGGIYEKYGR